MVEYWQGVDGTLYADENAEETLDSIINPATGHSFTRFLEWVWDGFKKAIAWFACEHDDTHIETYDVPVSVETSTEPTCTENGYIRTSTTKATMLLRNAFKQLKQGWRKLLPRSRE